MFDFAASCFGVPATRPFPASTPGASARSPALVSART
jgi:hypothetical protein